ncbi:MAG: isoprenylcysteine carboxylmethyltransferase family protein [Deferrisomatales bacterium]|nr:isoprenylcysteine carboxylmethyltransferase family protein [Deferrisomatales bacterium]
MPSSVQVFLGFAAYAVVHSALLTEGVRSVLEAVLGARGFRGLYRIGFTVQAVVLLAGYVVWIAHLPDAQWGEAEGLFAWVLWGVKGAALLFILGCVSQIGSAEFLGWAQFRAWRRGEAIEGDGVESGRLEVSGPYRFVRHPMYGALLVALWAEPHWSANRFAFVLAASLYLWAGSLHEERRLTRFYGQAYLEYMARTPRMVPDLRRRQPLLRILRPRHSPIRGQRKKR